MLKLAPEPTFVASVAIPVAGSPASLINVTYRHLGRKAFAAWRERAAAGSDDATALGEVIAGWDGVDTPYTQDALAELLDARAGSARALFEAYVAELGKAAEKN